MNTSTIQIRHSRFFRQKLPGFLLILWMMILFGAAIPAHHHDDASEHKDCALCIVTLQPSAIALLIFVVLPVFTLPVRYLSSFFQVSPRFKRVFDSRAPPGN